VFGFAKGGSMFSWVAFNICSNVICTNVKPAAVKELTLFTMACLLKAKMILLVDVVCQSC